MRVSTPRVAVAFLALLVTVPSKAPHSQGRQLSFEERVRAQEAIERVYYAHQVGVTSPFDAVMPRAALEGLGMLEEWNGTV